MQFKTDWKSTDYLTLDNFIRISQNAKDIRDEAQTEYGSFSQLIFTDVSSSTIPNAEIIREYLDNINVLSEKLNYQNLILPDSPHLMYGGIAWNCYDVNRMEQALKDMHNQVISKSTGLRLNFELGGIQF